MFGFFKIKSARKKRATTKKNTYDEFLMGIDNLSSLRLRNIDTSVGLMRTKLSEEGFQLTETTCNSKTVTMKRNQLGWYVLETSALNSKDEYDCYEYGINFLKEHQDEFERIHQLLCEKECIMRGYFNPKVGTKEELTQMAIELGYGMVRDDELFEDSPVHPSRQYQNATALLQIVTENKISNMNDVVIEECLEIIRHYFTSDVKLEIKHLEDKFDMDFDEYYGVLVIDDNIGDIHLLYGTDNLTVKKDTFEKYLKEPFPYLEVYLRIIVKGIKNEIEKNNSSKTNGKSDKK